MNLVILIILIIVLVIILTLMSINNNESFYFRRRRRRRRRGSKQKDPDFTPPPDTPSKNITYSDAQQKIAEVIGPSYNYIRHVKNPKQLGVKSSSDFDAIIKDTEALAKYVGYLVFGPGLGNNFWIKSGTCDKETSTPECQGQERWMYIKTIPDGSNPCLKNIGIDIPGGQMNGLIPGIMEDMFDIGTIPIELMSSLIGSNEDSFKCSMKTKKTGPSNNLKNESKCAPDDKAVSCLPEFFETKNQSNPSITPEDNSKFTKNSTKVWCFLAVVFIFLLIGFIMSFRR